MSDLFVDGNTRVSWVPTIATLTAPTAAELNGGTALESYITPTGLKIKPTTTGVDTSSLSSTFMTQGAGRKSYASSIEFKRQTPTDVAYNLLPYRTAGNLVVRRTLAAATAYASGQTVEVYPVVVGEPELNDPAPNEVAKFVSSLFMTSDPATRATVA